MNAPVPAAKPPVAKVPSAAAFFHEKVLDVFGLDVRSLALFRVGLGFMVLWDLHERLPDLTAHYSDAGAFPRSLVPNVSRFTIHAWSGSAYFEGALFLLTALFALALFVGYRTRLVTCVCWFLTVSLQGRNIAVEHGGDVLLRMLLFWGMFLPLGAYCSVDSLSATRTLPPPRRFLSVGSAALTLQICFVYWFAVIWKYGPEWREQGTAVEYALRIEGFSTSLARWLLNYPRVLTVLTHATVVVETLGPALVLFPFFTQQLRVVAVAALIGFHASLGLCIELGNFVPVCWVGWLALLSPWFWDKLGAWLRTPARVGTRICFDARIRAAARRAAALRTFLLLPDVQLIPVQEEPDLTARLPEAGAWFVLDAEGKGRAGLDALAYLLWLSPVFWPVGGLLRLVPISRLGRRRLRRTARRLPEDGAPVPLPVSDAAPEAPPLERPPLLAEVAALFFLVYVFLWNVRTIDYQKYQLYFPEQLNHLGVTLALEQGWGVFAPAPGKVHGWFVLQGHLPDGTVVDLWRDAMRGRLGDALEGGPPREGVSWEKPEPVVRTYINSRWRRFLMNLPISSFEYLLPGFAEYLRLRWNEAHPGRELLNVEIYFMRHETQLGNDDPPAQRTLLYRHGRPYGGTECAAAVTVGLLTEPTGHGPLITATSMFPGGPLPGVPQPRGWAAQPQSPAPKGAPTDHDPR
jgi:hypothetical protein